MSICRSEFTMIAAYFVDAVQSTNDSISAFLEMMNTLPSPFELKKKVTVSQSDRSQQPLDRSLRGHFVNKSISGEFLIHRHRVNFPFQKIDLFFVDFNESDVSVYSNEPLEVLIRHLLKAEGLAYCDVRANNFREVHGDIVRRIGNARFERKPGYGRAFGVPIFYPVHYWSNDFCIQTWGKDAGSVELLIAGVVSEVKMIGDGIFVRLYDSSLTDQAQHTMNQTLRSILGGYGLYNE